MARSPEGGKTLAEQLAPLAGGITSEMSVAPAAPETQPAPQAERPDFNTAVRMLEEKLATLHPDSRRPLEQRLNDLKKLAEAANRRTAANVTLGGVRHGLTASGVINTFKEKSDELVTDLPKLEDEIQNLRRTDSDKAFATPKEEVPAPQETIAPSAPQAGEELSAWEQAVGTHVPENTEVTPAVEETKDEEDFSPYEHLHGAKEEAVPTATDEEQFREILGHWGMEYEKQEASLDAKGKEEIREDAATLTEAGIPAQEAKAMTSAVSAYMDAPASFQSWNVEWKANAAPAPEALASTPEAQPTMTESQEALAARSLATIRAQAERLNFRTPEQHRGFFNRMGDRIDALAKRYNDMGFWKKAGISALLIGGGTAGVLAGGPLALAVGGVSFAGARALSALGAYGLGHAIAFRMTESTKTSRVAGAASAATAFFFMPQLVQYLDSQFGISKSVIDTYASLFGGSTPPGGVPAFDRAPVNPLDSGTPSFEGSVPPPVTAEDFLGSGNSIPPADVPPEVTARDFGSTGPSSLEGGSNGPFSEPSPELARYFETPITVRSGDTVWGLIQERLGPNGSPSDVLKRVEFLKSLPPEELKKLGIGPWTESFKGFMIKPGDTLDLSILDTIGAPKGISSIGVMGMPSGAGAFPTPEPIPAGIEYTAVAEEKFKDITSLFGHSSEAGLNAFHTRGWRIPVEQYLSVDATQTGTTGPIHGISAPQVSAVKEYLLERNAKYGIPLRGTLEQFMNKVAIAEAIAKKS